MDVQQFTDIMTYLGNLKFTHGEIVTNLSKHREIKLGQDDWLVDIYFDRENMPNVRISELVLFHSEINVIFKDGVKRPMCRYYGEITSFKQFRVIFNSIYLTQPIKEIHRKKPDGKRKRTSRRKR